MKFSFYPKLAWDGIRKNRRLYLPYILTCIGMVMMNYIIYYLTFSSVMDSLPGGAAIRSMLDFGGVVLSFFSALFLFYSNAFLIRRRKKEFGLYNILGMDKRSIGGILFWETAIVALLSMVLGILLGLLLSKLFELSLVKLMGGTAGFDFAVSPAGIFRALKLFGVIFLLLFLNSLRQVSLTNPMALLRSESAGEKPPKARWLLGLAGIVLLVLAYYLAVTNEDPIEAILIFFLAVAMVIAATYLIFIVGSVALCRLLQKNHRYYYKASHFVSVSSMAYRMKRNGAGLASICILLTMVLVSLSATVALYVGVEDSLVSRFPRHITVDTVFPEVSQATSEALSPIREKIDQVVSQSGARSGNVFDYRSAGTSGILENGQFSGFSGTAFTPTILFLIPIEDYNQVMGENVTLEEDEVLIFPYRTRYESDTFQIDRGPEYRVKGIAKDWIGHGESVMSIAATVYVFVPDLPAAAAALDPDKVSTHWNYGFDLDVEDPRQVAIYRQLKAVDWLAENPGAGFTKAKVECRAINRDDFYALYGGLFYLGILLSIVFLAAAVLIIYYKQLSEGYEDQRRFAIMRKVGMTQKDIRASINSQMLTVFALPIAMAGVHMCFAYPIVRRILLLFSMANPRVFPGTTVVCFAVFALFYAVVYRLTSNTYYSIVTGAREQVC